MKIWIHIKIFVWIWNTIALILCLFQVFIYAPYLMMIYDLMMHKNRLFHFFNHLVIIGIVSWRLNWAKYSESFHFCYETKYILWKCFTCPLTKFVSNKQSWKPALLLYKWTNPWAIPSISDPSLILQCFAFVNCSKANLYYCVINYVAEGSFGPGPCSAVIKPRCSVGLWSHWRKFNKENPPPREPLTSKAPPSPKQGKLLFLTRGFSS